MSLSDTINTLTEPNVLAGMIAIGSTAASATSYFYNKKIKALKKRVDELEQENLIDHMTGLYNKKGFYELGKKELALADRQNANILMVYYDVNNLKEINDTLGHEIGDELIKDAAGVIKSIHRETDIAARIGGDEFAVIGLLKDVNGLHACHSLHARLYHETKDKNNEYKQANKMMNFSMAAGCHAYTPEEIRKISFEEMIRAVDKQMYINKALQKTTL